MRTAVCFVFFLLLINLCAIVRTHAQVTHSTLRNKKIPVSEFAYVLDTSSIVPGSLSIRDIDSAAYTVNYFQSTLSWNKKPVVDSVWVRYRVFNSPTQMTMQRHSFDSVINNANPMVTPSAKAGVDGRLNFGNFMVNGSLSREMSAGNNQDLVTNSVMNLQVSGMLGDSIEVDGALTDNNLPIQPDGTTQQLNEFDQVYLQFKKKAWQLNVGDIDIRQSNTNYLNFYKRLQGIMVQTENAILPKATLKSLGSASVTKGRFTRNSFQGQEGNQGPYRLQAANNEFFFILLANTERVFIDGQLLTRGEDQDYVINYNTAEVTFTPKRMITKDSRIQVEFEYADRNFLNGNFFFKEEAVINKKWQLQAGLFMNADAKNSPINQQLKPEQVQYLSSIGDSINRAFYPAETIDSFSKEKILYEKKYVTTAAGIDSFYQYSTNALTARYNLKFIDVGQGNGNYVPDFNGANGKVYKYVSPIAGARQGNYEPAMFLVTPKKQRVFNAGFDYAPNVNTSIKGELGVSNYDPNTFSSIGNSNHTGTAFKVSAEKRFLIDSVKGTYFNTQASFEQVDARFKPLERLRAVEFTREWGLPVFLESATERLATAQFKYNASQASQLSYTLTKYQRQGVYNGLQQVLLQQYQKNNWSLRNEFLYTGFSTQVDKGYFLRPSLWAGRQFRQLKNWSVAATYFAEINPIRNSKTDTILTHAFAYNQYGFDVKSDVNKGNRISFSYFTRTDLYPTGKELRKGDKSYNYNLKTELVANASRQLYFNTTYRKLQVVNPQLSRQQADESVLGRIEYRMREWNDFLRSEILYEIGAGQEQKRDLAYIEVPVGMGKYTWIDYNGDGVKQLNEFEIARFTDQATYYQIYTPSNQYIKAHYNTFNYSLSITPAKLYKEQQQAAKHLWSRLLITSALQSNKKTTLRGTVDFNPFYGSLQDSSLILYNDTWTNTISFNRTSSKWGIDIIQYKNKSKGLLAYGTETRLLQTVTARLRLNLSKQYTCQLNGVKGYNTLFTANSQLGNKNYDIQMASLAPTISFIKGTRFRVQAGYKWEEKKNSIAYGGEKVHSNEILLESKLNIVQQSAITARFTMNNLAFTGVQTNTLSYILLDGLLPGQNYLWMLNVTRRIMKNLELNLQYDGRKTGAIHPIHTGRAAIVAVF